MNFGQKMKLIREMIKRKKDCYLEVTQETFGTLVGVSTATIQAWESEKRRPRKNSFIKILRFCHERNINISLKQLKDDTVIIQEILPRIRKVVKIRALEDYKKTSLTIGKIKWEVGRSLNNMEFPLYHYELAGMVGCDRSTISNYYCKRRVPQMYFRRRLIDLAFKYHVSIGNEDFIISR